VLISFKVGTNDDLRDFNGIHVEALTQLTKTSKGYVNDLLGPPLDIVSANNLPVHSLSIRMRSLIKSS
jgi:hypothetical protein